MATKSLTPKQANKLAIESYVVLIRMLEVALSHSFNGKSYLWGKEVGPNDLASAKNRLTELDRQRDALSKDLPYIRVNGESNGKTLARFGSSGVIAFVEVTEGTSGKGVERHVNTKRVITKQMKKSLSKSNTKNSAEDKRVNTMATSKVATSKKTASKVAPKKAAKKAAAKVAPKKAAKAGAISGAQQIRDAYDKNPKTFNIAEYAKSSGIAYGRVYGAIVKHEANLAAAKKGGAKK